MREASIALPRSLRFTGPDQWSVTVQSARRGPMRVSPQGDLEWDTDPTGRFVYALAEDFYYLEQYRIAAQGRLVPLDPPRVNAHSHPTDIAFHPNGRFAYVTCSHGAVCQYRVVRGALVPLNPAEVYGTVNPSIPWFDRTGRWACVVRPHHGGEYNLPPGDTVCLYRIDDGRLVLAREIQVRPLPEKYDAILWNDGKVTVR